MLKVTFDFSRRQIGIEGDGPELMQILGIAREIAPQLPSINIETIVTAAQDVAGNGHQAATTTTTTPTTTVGGTAPATMRQFIKNLRLENAAERITAIGYYQKHHDGRDAFSPKEMEAWFTQCGLQKPAQMSVAIWETKKKYGYLESVGHGASRVNNQGDNLIIGKLEGTA